MASITHDCLKIEGISEEIEILDFSMVVEPNQHARAKILFKYLKDIKPDKIDQSFENKVFKVKSTAKGNSDVLFVGYAEQFFIHMDSYLDEKNSFMQGELHLVSTTVKLDLEEKSQSFQDKSLSYKDVINKIECVFLECIDEAGSKKIEKPIIQYKETDWEFLLRMVSHFGRQLIPDETAEKPTLFFGIKEHGTVQKKESKETKDRQIDFRSIEYHWKKNVWEFAKMFFEEQKVDVKDFVTTTVRSRHNYKLCNKASFKGGSFLIVKKEAWTNGTEVDFVYTLGSKYYKGLDIIYNEKLHGCALEGKVLKAENEMVKIHLDIDKSQSEGTAFEYEWRPDTGNIFYCMPEKGMKVSLYIGTKDEREAYAINCMRRDDPKCAELKKPEDRYFTSDPKKRYFYKKDCMGFTNEEKDEGKNHVAFFDKKMMSIKSDKPIQIHADKKLVISSSSWTVNAKKEIYLGQKKNGFVFNKNVDIKGSSVGVMMMAGAGMAPKKDADKKASSPEKEKMKEEAIEKFSRYALVSKLSFDDSKRRRHINSAVNKVVHKNKLSKAAGDDMRSREGFIKLKNRRTPAYNKSYEVGGVSPAQIGAPYSQAEIQVLRDTRDAESKPDENTVMQKVLGKSEDDLKWYMGGPDGKTQAQIGNFVSKAEDALPSTENYAEARESLRLDYGDSKDPFYPENGKELFVVRYQSDKSDLPNMAVPYNNELDPSATDPTAAPCTGNGFLGGEDTLIPEYKAERKGISDGAIFHINDKGEEEVYAVYDRSVGHFVAV